MNALSKSSVITTTIGLLSLFGVIGYNTHQKAINVGENYKNYHKELAEIYVTETSLDPINGETYNAVFCPNEETSLANQCSHIGGKALQDLLNNLPPTTQSTPFKIFLRSGEYNGFATSSINEVAQYAIASIENSYVVLNGDFTNKPILNMAGGKGSFLINSSIVTTKNITLKNFSPLCNGINDCSEVNKIEIPVFTVKDSTLLLENVDVYNSALLNAYGASKLLIANTQIYESPTRFLNSYGNTVGLLQGLTVYQSKNPDYSVSEKLGLLLADYSYFLVSNSAFILNNETKGDLGIWFHTYNYATLKLTNSYVYGSKLNNYYCVMALGSTNINITNSVITNCNIALRIDDGTQGKINVKNSFIAANNYNVDPDSLPINFLNKPTNSDFFNDPQIFFNPNNLNDPKNFILPKGNIAIDAGDPTIFDLDGTVSDIGVLGGTNVCIFNSSLDVCKPHPSLAPIVIFPEPTEVLPTPFPSPIIISPTPIIRPTQGYVYDVDNSGRVDLLDVLLVIKAVFN